MAPDPTFDPPTRTAEPVLDVRIESVTLEADGIKVYELRPRDGDSLPPFTAGAHVDLFLSNGLVRAYSLCNVQTERHRYVIAVSKDPNSSGGSKLIHENAKRGDELRISVPRNNFPLDDSAHHSVLIAGGIGITPIWSMLQRLNQIEKSWELHYCVRTRANAAFLKSIGQLKRSSAASINLNFDHEPGGTLLDIGFLINRHRSSERTHFYCCGPAPMLRAFEQATHSIAPERVHTEYFTGRDTPATTGGFVVVLARSGRRIEVPNGRTILQTLLDDGLDIPNRCTQGTCGTCETGVLKGIPDHRDSVLNELERAKNKTMMICCSGCMGEELVLDL